MPSSDLRARGSSKRKLRSALLWRRSLFAVRFTRMSEVESIIDSRPRLLALSPLRVASGNGCYTPVRAAGCRNDGRAESRKSAVSRYNHTRKRVVRISGTRGKPRAANFYDPLWSIPRAPTVNRRPRKSVERERAGGRARSEMEGWCRKREKRLLRILRKTKCRRSDSRDRVSTASYNNLSRTSRRGRIYWRDATRWSR